MSTLPPDAALADELAPAQAHAERHFGAAPPLPWQPARAATPVRARTPGRRRLGVAAGAVLIVVVLGALLGWRASASGPPTAAVGIDPVPSAPPPVPARIAAATPAPAPAAASTVLALSREGPAWRIDAAGASRLAAAQRLAQLGAGTLHGDPGLLARTRPLDLRWEGARLADAWPAVLGHEASYALQCGRRRCEVWLIAAGTAMPVLRSALPLPAVPAMSGEATPVAPSDSADPRVAAHHD